MLAPTTEPVIAETYLYAFTQNPEKHTCSYAP